MASDAFAGTTFSFGGGAISDIVDIAFTENGNPIDVTDASDTLHKFLAGVTSYELVVTTYGVPATTLATAAGAISIAWNDGTTDTSGGNYICVAKNRSGSVGGAITTQLTFVPSA